MTKGHSLQWALDEILCGRKVRWKGWPHHKYAAMNYFDEVMVYDGSGPGAKVQNLLPLNATYILEEKWLPYHSFGLCAQQLASTIMPPSLPRVHFNWTCTRCGAVHSQEATRCPCLLEDTGC